jgi:hypothetical protein
MLQQLLRPFIIQKIQTRAYTVPLMLTLLLGFTASADTNIEAELRLNYHFKLYYSAITGCIRDQLKNHNEFKSLIPELEKNPKLNLSKIPTESRRAYYELIFSIKATHQILASLLYNYRTQQFLFNSTLYKNSDSPTIEGLNFYIYNISPFEGSNIKCTHEHQYRIQYATQQFAATYRQIWRQLSHAGTDSLDLFTDRLLAESTLGHQLLQITKNETLVDALIAKSKQLSFPCPVKSLYSCQE